MQTDVGSMGISLEVPQRYIYIYISYDTTVVLLWGTYPKDSVSYYRDTSVSMFVATLFTL